MNESEEYRTPQLSVCLSPELKPHHRSVLFLILQGKRNQEIADELNYSLHTVENYVTHILAVVDCRSRTELVVRLFHAKTQIDNGAADTFVDSA
jgi:DNA-binding NarL/FixJ family response regulator